MFKEYLINSILNDSLKVKKLLAIDEIVGKSNLTINDIINYIDNIKLIDHFNNKNIVIDGSNLLLLNILISFSELDKSIFIIEDNNKAINSYFIDVYNDYVIDNELSVHLDIKIQHNFKSNDLMIIGNKDFIEDTTMNDINNYNFIII
jgi:hypothetical protein